MAPPFLPVIEINSRAELQTTRQLSSVSRSDRLVTLLVTRVSGTGIVEVGLSLHSRGWPVIT